MTEEHRTLQFPEVRDTAVDLAKIQAQIEELERKYETMRLATLEWGKDVEKLQIRSDRHLQRIEALESAENYRQQDEDAECAYEPAPTGSLLERVSCAIDRSICPDQWLHQDAARAAITEVAAWLDTKGQHGCSLWLREEADRG